MAQYIKTEVREAGFLTPKRRRVIIQMTWSLALNLILFLWAISTKGLEVLIVLPVVIMQFLLLLKTLGEVTNLRRLF